MVRNNKNRDVNIGASSTMVDHEIGRKAWKLFSGGPQDIITRQQSMFVDSELGIRDNVSPNQLNKLLWQYAKKDKYWYAKIPGHILETLVYDIVFNGPWGGWLMKQRYNIRDQRMNSYDVVIVNYNGEKIITLCLRSIYNSEIKPNQVIIYDNASKDKSVAIIKKKFPETKLIRGRENIGFGNGNNKAMRYSKSDFILFVNNDVLLIKVHQDLIELKGQPYCDC